MLPYYRLSACLNMNMCVCEISHESHLIPFSYFYVAHTHSHTHAQARDQFAKSYSYSFRHMYGKEGSRKNYTPFSCMKIIMGSPPEAGAFHAAPSGPVYSSLLFSTVHLIVIYTSLLIFFPSGKKYLKAFAAFAVGV